MKSKTYEPETLVVGPVVGGIRVTPSTGDERARSLLCDVTPEPEGKHEVRGDEQVFRFTVHGVRLKDREVTMTCRQLDLVGRGTGRIKQYELDQGQLLVWFPQNLLEPHPLKDGGEPYPKNDLLCKFVTATFRAA